MLMDTVKRTETRRFRNQSVNDNNLSMKFKKGLTLMKKTTKNHHPNFKDFVPIRKRENIHKKANIMEEKIINYLLERVK